MTINGISKKTEITKWFTFTHVKGISVHYDMWDLPIDNFTTKSWNSCALKVTHLGKKLHGVKFDQLKQQ